MRRAFLSLSLLLLPAALAAQSLPGAGVVQAFMEGCLRSAQGSEEAEDLCKCTAKGLFFGPSGEEPDVIGIMVACSPGAPGTPAGG